MKSRMNAETKNDDHRCMVTQSSLAGCEMVRMIDMVRARELEKVKAKIVGSKWLLCSKVSGLIR